MALNVWVCLGEKAKAIIPQDCLDLKTKQGIQFVISVSVKWFAKCIFRKHGMYKLGEDSIRLVLVFLFLCKPGSKKE